MQTERREKVHFSCQLTTLSLFSPAWRISVRFAVLKESWNPMKTTNRRYPSDASGGPAVSEASRSKPHPSRSQISKQESSRENPFVMRSITNTGPRCALRLNDAVSVLRSLSDHYGCRKRLRHDENSSAECGQQGSSQSFQLFPSFQL